MLPHYPRAQLVNYYPDLKSSNQEIADLVKGNPDKFIGFGSVNPNKDEHYVEEKLREISDSRARARGAKQHLRVFVKELGNCGIIMSRG
jgi:predicted TIM-barrel fold metal-dependent hydrolase